MWISVFHREINVYTIFCMEGLETLYKDVKFMGYTTLYRKFRPLVFENIVGQEQITKTLRNQINANRVGHAYLFNGVRGTGKTSAAKVLARAINCLNPINGEPCNECEICKEALSGSLTDIVEMDAASNNSVEDIRSIREEVNFLPTKAKYRVYIIDEVHMLSTGAFNALLKTLEEPPEHVKFILATTEPQKLPATILSRCQRFDFKRIPKEDIIKRLKVVCQESDIKISEKALEVLASLSEGAMRDALSILERCIQNGDSNIDENKIKDILGIPKTEYIKDIVNSITEYDITGVLNSVDIILKEGKDLNNFLWEMVKYLKDILILKTKGNLDLYNEKELEDIKNISEKLSKERSIELIYGLSELENMLKNTTQKSIVFQAGVIKLCYKRESINNDDFEQRIKNLEEKISKGVVMQRSGGGAQAPTPARQSMNAATINEGISKPKLNPNYKVDKNWPQIVDELKKSGKIVLYTNLINTKAVEINDMTIGIEFPNGITPFGKTVLEKEDSKKTLRDLISISYGKEMNVKYLDTKKQDDFEDANSNIADFASENNIPFNFV